MPFLISEAKMSMGATSELPTTYDMKTQKLYTKQARQRGDELASKVGRSMMIHGPPRLSLQEQFENKPIPRVPQIREHEQAVGRLHARSAHADGNSLFATRKKVTDLRAAQQAWTPQTWAAAMGPGRPPLGMQRAGVMNPIANSVPTVHVRPQPIHMARVAARGLSRP